MRLKIPDDGVLYVFVLGVIVFLVLMFIGLV